MAQGEGYSTARPPLFNGEDFPYWKRRMEVYLKTDIDQWFAVQTGYTTPMDEGNNAPLKPDKWNTDMKKKAQIEFKAQNTLQCGLTKEELNRIGPTDSAKELWDKLIELHEGSSDAKVTKRDLLLNKLFNIKMQEGESASQLHARIKEILNGLHLIGHKQENRDIIRYALNAFPRNSLWASIVDAYKISRNLSKINLDELFCELELHEQTNAKAEKGIALFAGSSKEAKLKSKIQDEPEYESDSDSDEEEQLVNLVRKMFTKRKNKFSKRDIQKVMKPFSTEGKSNITCFSCKRKGHFKHECPYKNEDQPKKSKKKKALQATWDESSDDSDDEPPKNSSYLALMATGPGSDSELDEDSEYESSQEIGLFSDGSTKVHLDSINEKFFKIISVLNKKLLASESRNDHLLKENQDLKEQLIEDQILTKQTQNQTKLETENSTLKGEVQKLKDLLATFTIRSKNLDLILGSQKGMYNKSGIGYKLGSTQRSFTSFFHPCKNQRKAWVPKAYLTRQVGQNQYFVPQKDIHYINPKHPTYHLGGGTKLVGTSNSAFAHLGT